MGILARAFSQKGVTVADLMEVAGEASREFVGMANFERLFEDPSYRNSFKITAVFSLLVATVGISIALLRG